MAKITVNPISNNYSINVANANYCTVALPITASWGPAFENPSSPSDLTTELEDTVWRRFNATQAGLQSFVSTFRGPSANYRRAKDYSYQIALSLITNGYDVLVCRLCPGTSSVGQFRTAETISYAVLSSAPDDWSTSYTTYYMKNSSDEFVHVEAVDTYTANTESDWDTAKENIWKLEDDEYVQVTSKPDDWDEHYGDYFVKGAGAPTFAQNTYYEQVTLEGPTLDIQAKYPGTFGNNILVTLKKITNNFQTYWNAVVYSVDSSNIRSSLENLVFVFDPDNATDNLLHVSEVESNFIVFANYTGLDETSELIGDDTLSTDIPTIRLALGSDTAAQLETDTYASVLTEAQNYAITRYELVSNTPAGLDYIQAIPSATTDLNVAYAIRFREWTFTYATKVMDLLKDKLTYNPNRIISPWDDQNFYELGLTEPKEQFHTLSPMHVKLMDVAYNSRCATALLDIPKSLSRDGVWNDTTDNNQGYVQRLCRYTPPLSVEQNGLYTSSSALFAPWGQYTYAGTNRQAPASPSFLALMITRAMILNQANQYEWALPTIRSTNFKLGKLDYTVPEDLLMKWQSREGCRVNVITNLPEIGAGIWGNSTLFEVPPATYQALANLSTRFIFNAIQDVVYRVGIGITYQYSNANAYDRFYAGVTPILDTMSNLGALVKGADVPGRDDLDDPGYSVTMSADINGLDSVNANSVIGTIIIRTAGVIEDITIDLIALPQSAALTS